jgi:RND family efflux transporter MFP subunit
MRPTQHVFRDARPGTGAACRCGHPRPAGHRLRAAVWRSCLLALLACAPLPVASCAKGKAASSEEPAKAVMVHPVGRADIEDVLVYPADLRPEAEVHVFSRIADKILSFPWKDGDEIKRGQRIALIRTAGLSRGLEQVVAQTDALDVQIEHQKLELARLQELLDRGSIAQAEVDRLEASYKTAQAQRRALTASRGQLATTVSDGVITSAIDGVIADKTVEVGDIAAPAMPLCRVIRVDQLKVELRLVEADVPKVKVGQEVTLHLDAHPDRTFKGKVSVVLPYLEQQTRTNTVEVLVDNPVEKATGQRALKPGMYGKAELVVERRPQVLVAPEQALLLDNQILAAQKPNEKLRKAFVVGKDKVAHRRIVKLGARNGTLWQVLEGVKEGERLVMRGQHGLKDGQQVEIVEGAKK